MAKPRGFSASPYLATLPPPQISTARACFARARVEVRRRRHHCQKQGNLAASLICSHLAVVRRFTVHRTPLPPSQPL